MLVIFKKLHYNSKTVEFYDWGVFCMRTIIWFLYFWLSLILLVPSMLRAQFLTSRQKWEKRDRMVNSRVRWWMGSLLRLAGVEVTVSGLENIPNCPAVFVSNHQGNFDIPILLCNLDRVHGIVAKIELQKIPFIRIWMRYFNCVFIDRNNPRRSMAALNQAIRNIQEGGSMIIFPEGTRSRNDEVGEFKAGGFKIAQKTGAPIVPVCIGGSYKAMEANHMWIKPAAVRLHILPPIETSGLSREEFKVIGDKVRRLIIEEKG